MNDRPHETAVQRARRMMREIDDDKRVSFNKGEVRALLNHIAMMSDTDDDSLGCRGPVAVKDVRRGDVMVAKVTGGKMRPWIITSVHDDVVTALTLSSGEKSPHMIASACRLWPDSFIGNTLSMFPREVATREVTRPYTNLAHLAEVEDQIAAAHGMRRAERQLPAIGSLAEVRERLDKRMQG